MRRRQKGFSLIELLIVVAIILIIAAIAIPNLLRAKEAANEASAVESLRAMNTSSIAYTNTYGIYPASLAVLGPIAPGASPSSSLAGLIDSVLVTGIKSGYTFTWTAGASNQSYSITAYPTSTSSGQRTFYTDQSGVIRADVNGGTPTSSSTPLS